MEGCCTFHVPTGASGTESASACVCRSFVVDSIVLYYIAQAGQTDLARPRLATEVKDNTGRAIGSTA